MPTASPPAILPAAPPAPPLAAILAEALAALALPAEAAGRLAVTGEEDLPSCFPVTDLAVAAIGAAGLATAELLGLAGTPPRVAVDRHLASAWFSPLSSLRPEGWTLPDGFDPIAGDHRAADGWVRIHTHSPRHRAAALAVLGCADDRQAVADAVAGRPAVALETVILDAGGCAAAMRHGAEWRAMAPGQAVQAAPLIALERGEVLPPPPWSPDPARPLAGIRVLDLTRVLAGPVATRMLAGLGAEVLRIDPPDWEEPALVPDVTPGKRCARLDLRQPADRARFEALLAEADILVHGYRPAALARLGYDLAARRGRNPRLIDIALCAYGWTGPWAGRRGFDSLVQMATGIAAAGMAWRGAAKPVPLPVQALDHATGYLLAAAAIRGLLARQAEGVAMAARLSLARTAATLAAHAGPPPGPAFSGLNDADYAPGTERMAWGPARRLRPPLRIGDAALRWASPAAALGSSPAAW